jgi:hypothetical protein
MKNNLIFLLCGIVLLGYATMGNTAIMVSTATMGSTAPMVNTAATGNIVPPEQRQFQKIYEFKKTPKDILYDQSLTWISKDLTLLSGNLIIELQDKENGKIVGHGIITIEDTPISNTRSVDSCRYTIIIDVKDNKAKLTYKNLILISPDTEDTPVTTDIQMNTIKETLNLLSENFFN